MRKESHGKERPESRVLIARALGVWLVLALVLPIDIARAEPTISETALNTSRVDRLEQTLQSVVEENRRLAEEVRTLQEQPGLRQPEEPEVQIAPPVIVQSDSESQFQSCYTAGYDNGFVISPSDPYDSLFSLKINNQNTFRYTGFARDATSWTDSAGNVNPILNSSDFVIPRGRLIFSGNALFWASFHQRRKSDSRETLSQYRHRRL